MRLKASPANRESKEKAMWRPTFMKRYRSNTRGAKTGLDNLLKKATDMLEKVTDPKTQIQTMVLLMDLYKSTMIISTIHEESTGIAITIRTTITTSQTMTIKDLSRIVLSQQDPLGDSNKEMQQLIQRLRDKQTILVLG